MGNNMIQVHNWMEYLGYRRLNRQVFLYAGISFCISCLTIAAKIPLNNAIAAQSSTQNPTFEAVKAIDGKTLADADISTCTLTTKDHVKPWWRIKLDKVYLIKQVTLYNTDTNYQRLSKLNISVGNTGDISKQSLCKYYGETVPEGGSATITCDTPLPGVYISVQRTEGDGYLTLCEFEADGEAICSRPPNINRATWTIRFDNKTQVTYVIYICVRGYTIKSGNVRQCGTDGSLDTSYLECEKIKNYCDPPPLIDNAQITSGETHNYALGTSVIYSCKLGYKGATFRSCDLDTQAKGVWTASNFVCKKISDYCDPPPSVKHGYIISGQENSYAVNALVKYSCNTGYMGANGDTDRTCQPKKKSKGSWSGGDLICKMKIVVSIMAVILFVAVVVIILLVFVNRKQHKRDTEQDVNTYYNVADSAEPATGEPVNPYAHINLEEIHVPLESEKKYEQLKF